MLLTIPKIIGEKVVLRSLSEKDATPLYCSWLNDPDVNKFLETRESTLADLREYIKKRTSDPNSFFLGIFTKNSDRHIGNVKLEPINWMDKKATIGLLIGDKTYWGKGIGTEVIGLLINYAFSELHLEQIELGVLEEHKAAIKVYEKNGFKVDRIDVGAIRHGEKLFNKVIMSFSKS